VITLHLVYIKGRKIFSSFRRKPQVLKELNVIEQTIVRES